MRTCHIPKIPSIGDASWQLVKSDDKWTDGSRVLRRTIEIPEKINGYAVQGGRLRLDLNIASDGPLVLSVFSNGSLVYHGNEDEQQPILLTTDAQPGQKFVIAVRVDADTVPTRIARSQVLLEAPSDRPDPGLLRMQILAAQPIIAAYGEERRVREAQLKAAAGAIDFAALDRGDQTAFDSSLRETQNKLEVIRPWLKQFTIRAVGNSHIDMAWLWPWTETVEVVRNTFRSVLDLMREYPDFKFTMSSARTYEWMEEKYPAMFQEIEQRIKEGRWEVIGGMWVEPDLNMPGGESLVRQILVGKRYFKDKFGVDVKIGWNPDSFGYNWQLPQIYKKSGMDYLRDPKAHLGARIHDLSVQAFLVGIARRQPPAHLLSARLRGGHRGRPPRRKISPCGRRRSMGGYRDQSGDHAPLRRGRSRGRTYADDAGQRRTADVAECGVSQNLSLALRGLSSTIWRKNCRA